MENLDKYLEDLKKSVQLSEEAKKSGDNLLNIYKEIGKLTSQINKAKKTENDLLKKNEELSSLINKESSKGNDADYEKTLNYVKQIKLNEDLIKKNKTLVELSEEQVKQNKEALDLLSKTEKAYTIIKDKALIPIKNLLKSQYGYLTDQTKALRNNQLALGLYSKQAQALNTTLNKSALNTQMIGVSTKDLAEMQMAYTDSVGRSLMLNQEQAEAIANMSKGTVLGTTGASNLVAELDNFNISIERSSELVEGTMNKASSMGVSASKSAKSLENSLRVAQRFRFINGVKDAMDMAVYSAKFKTDMDSVSSMAENLLNPEGAVDMAAQLQVLGGQWSQLADPFTLMFKARNDFKGLVKDVTEATRGMGELNKETGEIEMSALEMHRLREVAKATGMSFENLLKTSREFNKSLEIENRLSADVDPELKDFLTSTAMFDKNKKEFFINLPDENNKLMKVFVNQLDKYPQDLNKVLKSEDKRLKERAEANQTFDDTVKNLIATSKQLLLPTFDALDKAFSNLTINLTKTELAERIKDFAVGAGKIAKVVADFMTNNPITGSILGAGALLGGTIYDAAKWFFNGITLGKGFLTSTRGVGGAGKGGFGGGMSSGQFTRDKEGKLKRTTKGKLMKTSGLNKGVGKAMGRAGGALAVGMAGINLAQNLSDEDLGIGEAILKTLDENKGLIAGAVLAPFTGGASLMAGGMLDSFLPTIGSYGGKNDAAPKTKFNDFVFRPGKDPMAFNENDTLIGLKDNGPIEKSFGKLDNKQQSNGKLSVSFDKPLRIEGSLRIESGNDSKDIDLNNPILLRNLTNIIQENIAENMNMGKKPSINVA